jgi:hypothetical protein
VKLSVSEAAAKTVSVCCSSPSSSKPPQPLRASAATAARASGRRVRALIAPPPGLEEDHPGVDVQLSFAGSSALVSQLEEGADADVLATAEITVSRSAEERSSQDSTPPGLPTGTAMVRVLVARVTDLAEQFEEDHPGVDVQLSFAGSSALVSQLEEGADADVLRSRSGPARRRPPGPAGAGCARSSPLPRDVDDHVGGLDRGGGDRAGLQAQLDGLRGRLADGQLHRSG